MKYKRLILIFLLTSLFSFYSIANRHEHFASWPTASSIEASFHSNFGTSIGNLDAGVLAMGDIEVTKPESRATQIYHFLFQSLSIDEQQRIRTRLSIPDSLDEADLPIAIGSKLDGKSIDEIIKLSTTKDEKRPVSELRKKFFKLLADSPQNKSTYAKVERMRINLFQYLKKTKPNYSDFLKDAYKNTILKIPVDSRAFIGFSVPGGLFNDDLKMIKDLFDKYDSDTHFYLSVPRGKLKKSPESQKGYLKKLKASLVNGWGNGIDLTGSMSEEIEEFQGDPRKNLNKNLSVISQILSSSKNNVLRFHAFEAVSEGSFYDEMFNLIREKANGAPDFKNKPFTISIGHIAGINESNIAKLKELRDLASLNNVPLNIVFDANYSSNEKLQGTNPKKIALTIKKLHEAGFEVGLGSDGTGILGRKSSVPWQANFLIDAGSSEETVDRLLNISDKSPTCNMNLMEDTIKAFLK